MEGVSRLRPLIAGLSPWRLGFDRRPLFVVFAVDIVALGRFFLENFGPPPLDVSFHWCFVFIFHSSTFEDVFH